MNLILTMMFFASVNLYFLKDSPDLLVRVMPTVQTEQLILYYSFSGTDWDSVAAEKKGEFYDVILKSPDTVHIIGIYCIYDDGAIDDNNGNLYLYELRKNPRMLMPLSLADLEVMIGQARKKIVSRVHVDEAIILLDYVDKMLALLPIVIGSPNELKRNLLRTQVSELIDRIAR